MENSVLGSPSNVKVTPTTGRVGEAAASAHGAVDKVAAVAGSAVRTVTSAINDAAASSHQAVNKMEGAVKPTENWINEKTEAILAAPKNAVSDARQFIVTHPWQSVGVALLAGAILGRRTR